MADMMIEELARLKAVVQGSQSLEAEYQLIADDLMGTLRVTGSSFCSYHPEENFCDCHDACSNITSEKSQDASRNAEFTLLKWQFLREWEVFLSKNPYALLFVGGFASAHAYSNLDPEHDMPPQVAERFTNSEKIQEMFDTYLEPYPTENFLIEAMVTFWAKMALRWRKLYKNKEQLAANHHTFFIPVQRQDGEFIYIPKPRMLDPMGPAEMKQMPWQTIAFDYGPIDHESVVEILPMEAEDCQECPEFVLIKHTRCHPECEDGDEIEWDDFWFACMEASEMWFDGESERQLAKIEAMKLKGKLGKKQIQKTR